MRVIADLHVHSHYSRATSPDCNLTVLHRVALLKGIGLVGTGDFTHPGWLQEIEQQLEPAEDGLFQLRPELRQQAEQSLPAACQAQVRFVLQAEISNIYKKADRTRKNHNLVFVPSLDAARALGAALAKIGNLSADGRPILGLDARDLLEITLESDPRAFLIPAHIWTPWFSMLGSKSGFDSLGDCFGDLSQHVFAAETGLSSDPPMNWRVRELDRLTLVSNSDAHSPGKLGREANVLDIELGYGPLLEALRTRRGWWGTVEFFPEEGKYHLDGHRKCAVRLEPEQTRQFGGRCPVCGDKLTVGVLSRVVELADRPDGARPDGASAYVRLVALDEVAAQACGVGPASKRARELVERLLDRLGPELEVLLRVPLEDIRSVGGAPVAEAVRRTRAGELSIDAGYDGEYGTVRIFRAAEREQLLGQTTFVPMELSVGQGAAGVRRSRRFRQDPLPTEEAGASAFKQPEQTPGSQPTRPCSPRDALTGFDAEQREAATTLHTPLLVVAGPGAGKTRTLVARIAHQVATGWVRPEQVLAITFTNQAADELRQRIAIAVPGADERAPVVCTFHGFGLSLLSELLPAATRLVEEQERTQLGRAALGEASERDVSRLLDRISLAKQCPEPSRALPDSGADREAFRRYQAMLQERGLCDIDDLVLRPYQLLERDASLRRAVARSFRSIVVDEYQDVNDVQAALVKLLAPGGGGLCVIGDPDQAIYGFRGARPGHFRRFEQAYPGAKLVSILTSYRLTQPVLRVAQSVLAAPRPLVSRQAGCKVELVTCPTPDSEGEQIVVRLERLVGGTSLFAVDSGRGSDSEAADLGFGDIAVLTRTRAQQPPLLAALGRSGIPCRTVGEDEPHDRRSQKVAVMTMHASKGREFEVVFVAGVERGLVPLQLEGLDADPQEESRLLYVAITRARRLLVLSHAQKRTLFGRALPSGASPLLARLPDDAVVRSCPSPGRPHPKRRQLSLFD
jgi:DNA helicase-2/ATP-dependent DNA helicase PcrA